MKRNPYRAAFGAMTLSLLVACSQGGGAPAEPAADAAADTSKAAELSLANAMQADRDFAAMSKKDGPKAAFLQYMHPTDSTFYQPGVVVTGAASIASGFDASPPGFGIDWTPDGGHGSASGDLAVTTGRYTIHVTGQPIEQGRYVTVWRKDEAGALKAVMDLGVPDPAAQAPTTPTPEKPDLEGRPG
jgi:ketosteroid isomerase-like protein